VAAREPEAFDTLYHHYAPYLRRFLRRRLPDPNLVDEVCHEVLLVAWQQAERFQGKVRLTTWLCGIGKHRAQKAWQRVTRQRASPLPTSQAGDAVADPVALLLQHEQHEGVAHAVAQLSPDLRTVVEAAYYQAIPYEAIATRLGCTVGTVQARLVRARRRLRAILVREERKYLAPCEADHHLRATARIKTRRPAGDSLGRTISDDLIQRVSQHCT
jgi:RNA polymerase sigma-70 factor (ECF subfamily)